MTTSTPLPRRRAVTLLRSVRWTLLRLCVVLALVVATCVVAARDASAASDPPRVLEAPLTGAVDPVMAQFVKDVLKRGEQGDYDAVVFTLDTPGGLGSSMDTIKNSLLNERQLPVFVYVAPSGAGASSAGVFIVMASDVAAMAPTTTIGSATPINSNGSDIGKDLRRKVINKTVSDLVGMARDHGRDEQFAQDAIRKATNLTAREALDRHVVEYVEPNLPRLLDDADGTTTKPKGLVVHTAGATVDHMQVPWTLRTLKLLIDPNILFLLFSGGLIGLAFELTHPGVFFPGVFGAIMLITALFGFQVLPVTTAGVVFLILAAALFATEVAYPTHGVLGVGGAVCLFLGGLLLFRRDSVFAINLGELSAIALVFAAFFVVVVRKVIAARRQPPRTGAQLMIGAEGVVRTALHPAGSVFVQGEIWQARAADEAQPIPRGRRVTVQDLDGLTVVVSDTGIDAAPGEDGRSDRPHTALTTDPSPVDE